MEVSANRDASAPGGKTCFKASSLGLFWHSHSIEAWFCILLVRRFFFIFSQFPTDSPELFPKVILPLALAHLLLGFRLDTSLYCREPPASLARCSLIRLKPSQGVQTIPGFSWEASIFNLKLEATRSANCPGSSILFKNGDHIG